MKFFEQPPIPHILCIINAALAAIYIWVEFGLIERGNENWKFLAVFIIGHLWVVFSTGRVIYRIREDRRRHDRRE